METGKLNQPTEGRQIPDSLSRRTAVALLLAFLGVVLIFVLALATMPPPTEPSSSDEQMDSSGTRPNPGTGQEHWASNDSKTETL
jgi:hypothetical protein